MSVGIQLHVIVDYTFYKFASGYRVVGPFGPMPSTIKHSFQSVCEY